jgi:hypothetical protein
MGLTILAVLVARRRQHIRIAGPDCERTVFDDARMATEKKDR